MWFLRVNVFNDFDNMGAMGIDFLTYGILTNGLTILVTTLIQNDHLICYLKITITEHGLLVRRLYVILKTNCLLEDYMKFLKLIESVGSNSNTKQRECSKMHVK